MVGLIKFLGVNSVEIVNQIHVWNASSMDVVDPSQGKSPSIRSLKHMIYAPPALECPLLLPTQYINYIIVSKCS